MMITKRYFASRFLLVSAVVVALFVGAGCGARSDRSPPPVPPPPVDENLLDLIPSGPNMVLWADLVEIRASLLWRNAQPFIPKEDTDLLPGVKDFDPVQQVDEILLIVEDMGPDNNIQFLVILKGGFSCKAIIDSYLSPEQAASSGIGPLNINGLDGVKTPEFVVVSITERTLAIGTESMVNRVTGLAKGDIREKKRNPDFEDLSLDGPVAASLRYHQGRLLSDSERYDFPIPFVDLNSITDLNGNLAVKDGVNLGIVMEAKTEKEASVIFKDLKKTRRKLFKNMFVAFLGIDWVLERISIKNDTKTVSISVMLNSRDVEELGRLVDRLGKLKELAEGVGRGLESPKHKPRMAPSQKQEKKK